MTTPIGPNLHSIESLRQQQALQAAFQTGEAGRLGKKEQAETAKEPQDTADGLDVKGREALSDGKVRTTYHDGRKVTTAPNGVIKEETPCGKLKLSLPSGILIQRDADGTTLAYDTHAKTFLPVKAHQETPHSQFVFTLQDAAGNEYQATSNTLRFQVQNPSETLTEKVHASGSVNIQTKQLMRNPHTGQFHQDQARVFVEKDGTVHKYGQHLDGLKVTDHDVKFALHHDVHTDIDFPYHVPQLHQHPQPHPQPPAPHPQPPVPPTPVPPSPVDPYGAIATPSGVIRQSSPDGSSFISLPNGIVVARHPDGPTQAFDASRPAGPLPVVSREVCHPGVGKETEYNFKDARGNAYQVYSKSLDFCATSPDGNLQQVILPQGNILMQARTFSPGHEGQPVARYHQVEVYPNGWVNTFGQRGVYLNNNTVTFAGPGKPTTMALPYPVPPFQGIIGWTPHPSPPYASQPVSGHQPQVPGAPTPQPWINSTEETQAPAQAARTATQQAAHQQRPAVNPSIWQRIKNFFGSDEKSGPAKQTTPYPAQPYVYGPDPALQMFWAASAATTAMSLFTMATLPMGFFYTPFIPILW